MQLCILLYGHKRAYLCCSISARTLSLCHTYESVYTLSQYFTAKFYFSSSRTLGITCKEAFKIMNYEKYHFLNRLYCNTEHHNNGI